MVVVIRASKHFLRKSVANRIVDGNAISEAITKNADDFKTLTYDGKALGDMNEKLSNAKTSANSGDREAIAALKEVNKDWNAMFEKTVDEVSVLANGSEAIILKAGMTPTSSTRKKRAKPERPSNTTAKPGNGKGTCAIEVDAQPEADGYIGVLTPTDAKVTMNGDTLEINCTGTIYIQASSRRTMQINGLPSYTPFCATVFTFNSAGASPLSNSEEMGTQ